MKRKHAAQLKLGVPGAGDGGAAPLPSPSSAGAMDSLLEKLRAAAPQTRDQRDRRRRARLKDRHQVRLASGQKVPDLNEIPEIEAGLQSAKTTGSFPTDGEDLLSPRDGPGAAGAAGPAAAGDEDDVAARAAMLLQGMRGDGADEADEEKRESMRRARRQTAEDERKARRRRREKVQSGTSGGGEDAAADVDATPVSASAEDRDMAD